MIRMYEIRSDKGLLPAVVIGFLASLTSAPTLAQTATSQQCVKDEDIRRIEIRFADGSGSLPCSVIYRPETEKDTVGIVSWQDIETVPACEAQANEVVDLLTLEGWSCTVDGIAGDSAGTAARGEEALLSESGSTTDTPPEGTATAALGIADRSDVPAADAGDGQTIDEADEPAEFLENPDVAPPSDDLVTLIKGNLDQLDTTIDGRLEAKIVGYGDLNADDVDDALVLYTYTSPQPAYRQFLAAYVFDGDAYQLTATRPISGHVTDTKNARIEAIDRGVVHLSLEAFEPGDSDCCPSGKRHMALALQELDLIEIEADAPTR